MREAETKGQEVLLVGLGDERGVPINFKEAGIFVESMTLLVLGLQTQFNSVLSLGTKQVTDWMRSMFPTVAEIIIPLLISVYERLYVSVTGAGVHLLTNTGRKLSFCPETAMQSLSTKWTPSSDLASSFQFMAKQLGYSYEDALHCVNGVKPLLTVKPSTLLDAESDISSRHPLGMSSSTALVFAPSTFAADEAPLLSPKPVSSSGGGCQSNWESSDDVEQASVTHMSSFGSASAFEADALVPYVAKASESAESVELSPLPEGSFGLFPLSRRVPRSSSGSSLPSALATSPYITGKASESAESIELSPLAEGSFLVFPHSRRAKG